MSEASQCEQIALTSLPLSACPPCDCNQSGGVSLGEVAQARANQSGCPAPPNDCPPRTSTPTPSRTVTPTAGGATPTRTNSQTHTPQNTPTSTAISLPSPSPTLSPCLGDCNGDGAVSAEELTKITAIIVNCPCASGVGGTASGCPSLPDTDKQCLVADFNVDGCISAGELTRVVANIVAHSPSGCPPAE